MAKFKSCIAKLDHVRSNFVDGGIYICDLCSFCTVFKAQYLPTYIWYIVEIWWICVSVGADFKIKIQIHVECT